MKKILSALLLIIFPACSEKPLSLDEVLPPGTFNLSTIIMDANGNSLDLAGDWAVFQDPSESRFTKFIHYDQTRETIYSADDNKIFMMEYLEGRGSLPYYEHGIVNKSRGTFLQTDSNEIIYKDGRIHADYRDFFILYNAAYGPPELMVILDDDTISFEDLPNTRLRRIKSFLPDCGD